MKRLLIFILMLGCFTPFYAQSRLGVTTDASLVWQIDDIDNTTAKTGAALSIGGLYQFQNKKFLMQLGLGFSPAWLRTGIHSQNFVVDMLDTEGVPFTHIGSINKRTDLITAMDLTVPLMVGFTVDGVYVLMGAKVNVTVSGKTNQKAYLTTVGDYGDRYYGVFENMPEHGFYNEKLIQSKGEIQLRPDLHICAEVGWNTPLPIYARRSNAPRLLLGAFFEYGVLNTLDKDNELFTEVDYSQHMQVHMNNIFTTFDRGEVLLNNIRAGIRATILFPLRSREERICDCIKD